jgi:amino acid permease
MTKDFKNLVSFHSFWFINKIFIIFPVKFWYAIIKFRQEMDTMQEKTQSSRQKTAVIWISVIAVLFLASIITGVIFLARSDPQTTGRVRDIFIIVLALESLLIGAALIILVIQLAVLTNIIQNEVKPILTSTKQTASTIKGTSQFISKHAVGPVISIGSFIAGFRRLGEIVGFIRQKNK